MHFFREYRIPIILVTCLAALSVLAANLQGYFKFSVKIIFENVSEHITEWLISASVACIFAIFTAYLIERRVAKRVSERINDAFTEFGSNFFGALYSDEIVEKAKSSTFSSTLIRRNYKHTVEFSEGTTCGFVRLTHTQTYTLHNTSPISSEVYVGSFTMEDASSLYGEGYVPTKLKSIAIGEKTFTQQEIEDFNCSNYSLGGELNEEKVIKLGEYILPASPSYLKVKIVSETQETENGQWVNTTYLPVKGLTIEVRNSVPNLGILIFPIGNFKLGKRESIYSASADCWRVESDDVLMPNYGWNIRWNVIPDAMI